MEDLTGKTATVYFHSRNSRQKVEIIDGEREIIKIRFPESSLTDFINRYWICKEGKPHPYELEVVEIRRRENLKLSPSPSNLLGGMGMARRLIDGKMVGALPTPSFHGIQILGLRIGVGTFPDDGTPCTWIGKSAFYIGG